MANLRQFSNTGSGFGQAAYNRARASGLSDSQIRSSLASSGLTIGAKVANSGSGGVDLKQFSNTGTGFGQAAYNRALSSGLSDSQIRSSLASSGLTIGAKVTNSGSGGIDKSKLMISRDGSVYKDGETMAQYGGTPAPTAIELQAEKQFEQQMAEARWQTNLDEIAGRVEIQRQEKLQREAEEKQAENLRQMEIGARTEAANRSRAGMQSRFQINSGSNSPQTAGTQGFKRRQLQVNPRAYSALATGAPNRSTLPGAINP